MEIKVTNCGDCPFRSVEYDDYSMKYDTFEYCNLSGFLNLKDRCIDAYNSHDKIKTCDYCDTFDYYNDLGEENLNFDKTKCTCDDINNTVEKIPTPKWCPLNDKLTIEKI